MFTHDAAHGSSRSCAHAAANFKWHLLCCMALCSGLAHGQPLYERLVQKARDGDYAPALEYLRQQRAEASPRYLRDHLLIAGWAGEDQEVIRLWEQQRTTRTFSADELATVARAYRNLRQWPQSLQVSAQGLLRFSSHEGLQLGRVMTLADAGKFAAAITRGRMLVDERPESAERRLALAYAFQSAGQPYAALAELDRALALRPLRADVCDEYLSALQRAGLAQPALQQARCQPQRMSPARRRQVLADSVAEHVRLSDLATRSERERNQLADRALTEADTLLAQWRDVPEAQADRRRVQIDRIGALHTQVRMPEVLEAYQQLQAEQVSLPPYALRWVASAALYMRRPELAAELYAQLIAAENAKHPDWMEDNRSLFYARVESWQPEQALQDAEAFAAGQPLRLYQRGNPELEPNPDWLQAQVLRAAALMENNQLEQAQQMLTGLVTRAPDDTDLKTTLASLYLSRGWPRRAESLLKQAESVTPRSPALEVEQGVTALQLQAWPQAAAMNADLAQRYPETLPAQHLEHLYEVYQKPELRVSAYAGKGSGSTVSGERDLGIDTLFYSAPLGYNWRLFAGAGYASGDFDEGRAHHRWQRAGAEWRVRNHTLEAEVSRHAYGEGDKYGARLSGIHDIDDDWQYGWSADYLSTETPLRALNSGITADSLSAFVRWRGDEGREWRLSSTSARFSDDNNRFGLVLDGEQRLYTRPRWQADLGLELAFNRNSGDGEVPYFNPKSETVLLPRIILQQTLHQRYETAWTQQFELGGGAIRQHNYGTDAAALISYSQRLRFDDRFDGGLGVSALSRAYDGDREQDIRLLFDLNYRF